MSKVNNKDRLLVTSDWLKKLRTAGCIIDDTKSHSEILEREFNLLVTKSFIQKHACGNRGLCYLLKDYKELHQVDSLPCDPIYNPKPEPPGDERPNPEDNKLDPVERPLDDTDAKEIIIDEAAKIIKKTQSITIPKLLARLEKDLNFKFPDIRRASVTLTNTFRSKNGPRNQGC